MTLEDAIKRAKSEAAKHGQTMFVVLDPSECDDEANCYHFGCAAAVRALFRSATCVASVHPDSRVIEVTPVSEAA